MIGPSLLWVVSLLVVVVGLALLVSAVRPGRRAPDEPPGDALRILEERYARGEIDEDEFHQRRRTLMG